jgi:hypothetical protein
LNFVQKNLGSGIETVQQARAAVAPNQKPVLEALLKKCEPMSEQADPIGMARNWQRAGLIEAGQAKGPDWSQVAFRDSHELREKMARFLADEPSRHHTARSLRADLEARLSYEAGLKRACRRIEQLLRTEPCA